MSRFLATALIGSALFVPSVAVADPFVLGVADDKPELIPISAGGIVIKQSCNGYPVLTAQHVALQYARFARDRLDALSKQSKSSRKSAWDGAAEKKWLGSYSDSRFQTARTIVTTIASVLDSPRLEVSCDTSYPHWAHTWSEQLAGAPRYDFIELGRPWLLGAPGLDPLELAGEREQTLVHEAAHHGGANRGEFLGRMGVSDALKRASKYPNIAVRSAENHGYYAICRASNSPACTP